MISPIPGGREGEIEVMADDPQEALMLLGTFRFVDCRSCGNSYCFYDSTGNFDSVRNGQVFGWCRNCARKFGH